MFYLVSQVALLLLVAVVAGVLLGWWFHRVAVDVVAGDDEVHGSDFFDARSRLEQCHRDNATLRRELQDANGQIQQFSKRLDNASGDEQGTLARLEAAEAKAVALMEDLQLRDDTIAVLERELEQLR